MRFGLLFTAITTVLGSSLEIPIRKKNGVFYGEILLGSDKQNVDVVLDTEDDKIVMNSVGSKCIIEECQKSQYNYNTSNTFEKEDKITTRYPTGFFEGIIAHDQLKVDDQTIDELQFIVSEHTLFPTNIIGLGVRPVDLVEAYSLPETEDTTTFMDQLSHDGIIDNKKVSMWFDDSEGAILFGDIDDSKYDEDLHKYPMAPLDPQGNLAFLGVNTSNGISVSLEHTGMRFNGAHLLAFRTKDSSSYFPPRIYKEIISQLSLTDVEEDGTFKCQDVPEVNQVLIFDDFYIEIPVSKLITQEDDDKCQLNMFSDPSSEFRVTLGTLVLKYIYIVFDMEEKSVSLGVRNGSGYTPSHETESSSSTRTSTSSSTDSAPRSVAPTYYAALLSLLFL